MLEISVYIQFLLMGIKMSEVMRLAGVYSVPKQGEGFLSYKVESTRYSVEGAYYHTAQLPTPTYLSLFILPRQWKFIIQEYE
jgi:hypothetical protein